MPIVAQVAAFHPFQDHVVARLKRQVQVWHQARFGREGEHQILIRLDRIDGGDAQPRQVRHQPQDPHHQIAEARLARPLAETVAEVPPDWADWIADLDDRMTGTCR